MRLKKNLYLRCFDRMESSFTIATDRVTILPPEHLNHTLGSLQDRWKPSKQIFHLNQSLHHRYFFIVKVMVKGVKNKYRQKQNRSCTSCASTYSDLVSSKATLFSRNCICSIRYIPDIQIAVCRKSASAKRYYIKKQNVSFKH